MVGAFIYGLLTLSSIPTSANVERPSLASLVMSGSVIGALFVIVVLIPLFLAVGKRRSVHGALFVLLGSIIWFAICFLVFLALGIGANGASATAV
jgi:Na+/melibiose symporter-like transporter